MSLRCGIVRAVCARKCKRCRNQFDQSFATRTVTENAYKTLDHRNDHCCLRGLVARRRGSRMVLSYAPAANTNVRVMVIPIIKRHQIFCKASQHLRYQWKYIVHKATGNKTPGTFRHDANEVKKPGHKDSFSRNIFGYLTCR